MVMFVEDSMWALMTACARGSAMLAVSQSVGLDLFAAVGGVPRVKAVGSILM
jgi:hypothetical protein